MQREFPRILIGAFRGGAGKTLVSLGLLAAWRSREKKISVFKKGPDYIDAAWLTRASGAVCYNLDTYLLGEQNVLKSFCSRTGETDLAVVEGNRGLFDGMDAEGRHSSAALAELLGLSVFLVVDATKSTRTIAALLKGCQIMDEGDRIQGVILNQVATPRHESVIRRSIEKYCGLPVLGAIPRVKHIALNERHLGLLPPEEHDAVAETVLVVQKVVESHVDLDTLWDTAAEQSIQVPLENRPDPHGEATDEAVDKKAFSGIRVGVARDAAFRFYYPENIEALCEKGAEIVEIEAAQDHSLAKVDALYIGGGFPETHARELAENESFKSSLRRAVEKGLPVYAECGGAIYLGQGLEWENRFYPLAGVFPVVYTFHKRPQGHGYTLLDVENKNPMFPRGKSLKGHEFHYAGVSKWERNNLKFACKVKRGYGFDGSREGLWYKNAYATFSHLHSLGESQWADWFLKRAAAQPVA